MVLDDGESCSSVATLFDIPRRSLARYVEKKKKSGLEEQNMPNSEDETLLADYLHRSADIYFGLSPIDVRKLAYLVATKLNLKIPTSWTEKLAAGPDWFASFMKRHPTLAIRKPEATSLARTSSFNIHNCNLFFDNYQRVLVREKIGLECVWNMDEIGVTTVSPPEKIVGRKGQKQIGSIVSGERGVLVTVVCAVSSYGNSIPPFFVFPRVNFKNHFLAGGPLGCDGTANKSGWMNDASMDLWIKHFIKYVRPSKERPVLLLLDNHSSHMSVNALHIAKENYVHFLSFPAHCSHRLQPLDVSVYGPMKKYVSSA
ncbi:hypothetical protein DAPPUDRAFT_67142, partial [Daphnia pulex]